MVPGPVMAQALGAAPGQEQGLALGQVPAKARAQDRLGHFESR